MKAETLKGYINATIVLGVRMMQESEAVLMPSQVKNIMKDYLINNGLRPSEKDMEILHIRTLEGYLSHEICERN